MATSEDGKGYLVPTPAQPYDSVCIKVYIPNHVLYIGAFWQAYQFFTTWLAWARDPLKRGKQAAALWRTAYDKARSEFELRKGSCDMAVTDIRLNPNDKCDLQVRYDGGDWTSVADLSDCGGCGGGSGAALQFDGINISQYNNCSGEFEPTGEPFDPVTKGIYDSLYSPSSAGACNGAANIAAWSKYVSDESLSILATAGIAGAAGSFIVGTLASQAGAMFLLESLLAGLLAELVDSGELLGDAADIDISSELQDILYPFMGSDGTIREPNFTEAVNALYDRRNAETIDTPERVRWGHEANIISALGPYVISRQNKYAGITDADCTSAGWTHVFDFTTGSHSWVEAELASAELVAGEGWKSVLRYDDGPNAYRVAQLKTTLSPRTITGVKIYVDATIGSDDLAGGIDRTRVSWSDSSGSLFDIVSDIDAETGENILTWSGSRPTVTSLWATSIVGFDGEPAIDPGGTCTIKKIVLSGAGTDPFPP